jgi:hypothetical protein
MHVRNKLDLAGLYSQMFVTKDTVLSTNSDLLLADYKHSQITNVKCFITLGPGTLFTKLYFFCNLECERLTTLGQKGLSVKNTLAYWIHS